MEEQEKISNKQLPWYRKQWKIPAGIIVILVLVRIVMLIAKWQEVDAPRRRASQTKKDYEATMRLHEFMKSDFAKKSIPNIITELPKLVMEDDMRIHIMHHNTSQTGTAEKLFHYYVLHTEDGRYLLNSAISISHSELEEGIIDTAFNYPPNYYGINAIDIKAVGLTPADIDKIIIVMKFRTLYPGDTKLHCEGFICNGGNGSFERMPPETLETHLLNIREQNILEDRIPTGLWEEFAETE